MPSYTNYSFDYYYLCTSLYIFSLGYGVIFLELSLKKWVSILEVAFRVVLFKWERKQIFSLSLKLFLNTTWQIPTNVNKNNHHPKETRNSVGDQKFFVENIPS